MSVANDASAELSEDAASVDPGSEDDLGDTPKKVLSERELTEFEKKEKRKGIIHLTRIPPYMKPAKLRQLLGVYGTIGRIYLKPEDASARMKRKKLGGNRKEKFTEGWVEFAKKSVAKRVALSLNNQAVGGKKRDFHASDIWNMKYLSKFKWSDLTERLAYEKRIKTQRLKTEMTQAKKDVEFFMSKVDQAGQLEKMEARKAAQGQASVVDSERDKVRRMFKQKPAVDDAATEGNRMVHAALLSKVLGASKKRKAIGSPDGDDEVE